MRNERQEESVFYSSFIIQHSSFPRAPAGDTGPRARPGRRTDAPRIPEPVFQHVVVAVPDGAAAARSGGRVPHAHRLGRSVSVYAFVGVGLPAVVYPRPAAD